MVMEGLPNAVGLRALDLGSAVLDLLQVQIQRVLARLPDCRSIWFPRALPSSALFSRVAHGPRLIRLACAAWPIMPSGASGSFQVVAQPDRSHPPADSEIARFLSGDPHLA